MFTYIIRLLHFYHRTRLRASQSSRQSTRLSIQQAGPPIRRLRKAAAAAAGVASIQQAGRLGSLEHALVQARIMFKLPSV